MRNERLIPRRTPEAATVAARTQVVMDLTSRLNVLPHSDINGRQAPNATDVSIWIEML